MKSRDFVTNLREMTLGELEEKQGVIQEELFRLRYQAVTEQSDNTSAIKEKQKDLARVLTVSNGRKQGVEQQKGV